MAGGSACIVAGLIIAWRSGIVCAVDAVQPFEDHGDLLWPAQIGGRGQAPGIRRF